MSNEEIKGQLTTLDMEKGVFEMGYNVTTLNNIPTHLGYYFFLIGDYRDETLINNFFRERFKVIAKLLGEDAGIIEQNPRSKMEDELRNAFEKCKGKYTVMTDFMNEVSSQSPGLVISKEHPDNFTGKPAIFIPFSALNQIYRENIEELVTDIVGFARGELQLITKTGPWAIYS